MAKNSEESDKYLSYHQSLDESSKVRYDMKLQMLGSIKQPVVEEQGLVIVEIF